MRLVGPDGVKVPIEDKQTFGRGRCGISDPSCSRQQFTVQPIVDVPACLLLVNTGSNALLVERLNTGAHSAEPVYELSDFLETGESATVGADVRFFLAERQSTTLFVVESSDQHVPGQQQQQQQPIDLVDHEPGPGTQPDDPMASAAFQLLRVTGLSAAANSGLFGASLRHLVSGPMRFALVSNYMIDMPWLLSAVPDLLHAAQLEGLVVCHGERHPARATELREALHAVGAQHFIIHAPPLKDQWGVHHSKAFILEYEQGLRVIVHTANLIYCDCNNKSQGLWYQDFPRVAVGSSPPCPFKDDLVEYVKSLWVPRQTATHLLQLCDTHDFSKARAHLIASRPGTHKDDARHKNGHMAVRRRLGAETFDAKFAGAPIVGQFSSMGSLTDSWVRGEFIASLAAGRPANAAVPAFGCAQLGMPSGSEGIQFVWPTVQEVRNSIEGWAAGSSIPGSEASVSKSFLQQYYHRFGGETVGRQRAMPHIKTYTRYRDKELAWAIVGSHNLSKAAWGALQKKETQLHIRHFELSVLVLPSLEAAYRQSEQHGFCAWPYQAGAGPAADAGATVLLKAVTLKDADKQPANVLRVPLPYTLPPHKYGQGDVPWAIQPATLYEGRDSLGLLFGQPLESMYGHVQGDD